MVTVRLSSKGQIVIPKSVRQVHGWPPGQEFVVEEAEGGVLLRPRPRFAPTTVDAVFGSLPYAGPPLSVEAMDAAVREAVRAQWTPAERGEGR